MAKTETEAAGADAKPQPQSTSPGTAPAATGSTTTSAADSKGSGGVKPAAVSKSAVQATQAGGAIAALTADHRRVDRLFTQYEAAEDEGDKPDLIRKICAELIIHTLLEEQAFYPACRQASVEDDALDEAQVEHDSAKVLIADLLDGADDDRDEYRDAKVSVLAEQIRHHVQEEEKPGEGLFAKAKAAGVDTPQLADTMSHLRQTLKPRRADLRPSRPVSLDPAPRFSTGQAKEQTMARYGNNDRDRDDRGRFTSDDDRGYRGENRSYASRDYGAARDHGSGGFYGAQHRDRDEYGRFASDDDDRGYRGSSSGYRGGQERDDRGRYMSDNDRDDRGGYGGRGQHRDHDPYGRFASDDDRGRGGYDRDDRGRYASERDYGGGRSQGEGRGWYGDPQGHSEAARRGWEERGGYARSRDDDDDRVGRGRGQGHGGWFGDPEGHAEASRRGWQDRR